MLQRVLNGVIAGAAGTVALNVTTYADMAIRGRGSSSVPAEVAGTLANRVGLDPGAGLNDSSSVENRKSGLGALMGYQVGLGVGAAYGLLIRPLLGFLPTPMQAIVLGAAAMAASDVPAVKLGVTDPAEWGATGWAADIVPHLAYGLVTALTYEALAGRRYR